MSLFEELKRATRKSHDDLEKNLDLLSPDLTIDDYIRVLKKFFAVYRFVESEIKKSPFNDLYSERWKLLHLIKDLKHFGLSDSEIDALPVFESFEKNLNPAELLGVLYVLEGSTLGSQILSKHFAAKFHLTHLNGLSFFTAYGSNTNGLWREWREISENLERDMNLSREEILFSATKTFEGLRFWMCSDAR